MKHGDLSNVVGYTFGFRVDDFLVQTREDSAIDKVANLIRGKYKRAQLNEDVARMLEYIYRRTEFTADLVADETLYPKMHHLIEELPFNRVILINKPSHITSRLLVGDITYYVDDDKDRLSLINSSYAVTLAEVHTILRNFRRGK